MQTGVGLAVSERDLDLGMVQRVQAGDKAAFDVLVRKYQHRVGQLIARYLQDPAAIEDVVQETFIKAYRGLGSFRGDSAFYTWLYRIATNCAKSYLLAAGRRVPGPEPDPSQSGEAGPTLRDWNTPEQEAVAVELGAVLRRALNDLPRDLREAVILREVEGLSYAEIACALDCPMGTVRSRISRAREAIDRAIRPFVRDAGSAYGD